MHSSCVAGSFGSNPSNPNGQNYGCIPCAAGKYDHDQSYNTVCSDCPPGRYQDGVGKWDCKLCVAGKYTTQGGQHACTDCAPGHFDKDGADGGDGCPECPGGKYVAAAAQLHCVGCPGGQYSPAGSDSAAQDCKSCPIGKHNDSSILGDECWTCPRPERTFPLLKTVSAVTESNPGVATSAEHDFETGDVVYFSSVSGGMANELNAAGAFTITRMEDDKFNIGVNTSGWGDFAQGGKVSRLVRRVSGYEYSSASGHTDVTAVKHGFRDGDRVYFSNCTGGGGALCTGPSSGNTDIVRLTDNTFRLVGVNSSSWGSFGTANVSKTVRPVTSVSRALHGEVTSGYHGLWPGATVRFSDIPGMTQLNSGRPYTVHSVISANQFRIETNTSNFSNFTVGSKTGLMWIDRCGFGVPGFACHDESSLEIENCVSRSAALRFHYADATVSQFSTGATAVQVPAAPEAVRVADDIIWLSNHGLAAGQSVFYTVTPPDGGCGGGRVAEWLQNRTAQSRAGVQS